MDLDIVNCFINAYKGIESMEGNRRMAMALRDFMIDNGTVNYLHNHEIYTYLMKFSDDGDTCVTKQMLEDDGMNIDPISMNEENLFNYIRGEMIHTQKLSKMLHGFGATQVEQY
jgi:hypothetical protein